MAQPLSGAVHLRDIDVSKDEESSSDERRVRPRHSTPGATASQLLNSPAKHFTARRRALAIDDLLQSFFKFLGLGELATVMRVCKYWRNFVTDKMPCTGQKLRLLPTLLLGPSRSSLVRHVSELSFDPTDEEISGEALFVLANTNWHNLTDCKTAHSPRRFAPRNHRRLPPQPAVAASSCRTPRWRSTASSPIAHAPPWQTW